LTITVRSFRNVSRVFVHAGVSDGRRRKLFLTIIAPSGIGPTRPPLSQAMIFGE
jgi:hypothetical protein